MNHRRSNGIMMPYSVVEVYKHFGANCSENGGRRILRNVANIYQTARHRIHENLNLINHRRENPKYQKCDTCKLQD